MTHQSVSDHETQESAISYPAVVFPLHGVTDANKLVSFVDIKLELKGHTWPGKRSFTAYSG